MHLSQQDRQFLQIFKYGIPCRSHILPSSLRNIKYIRERQSEIMTGYCKVKRAHLNGYKIIYVIFDV